MLLPHLNLSKSIRGKVIVEEMAEGREVWSEMQTIANGENATVYACKQWGAILSASRVIVLDHYPLQELSALNFDEPTSTPANDSVKPIYEQRQITAKYRVTEVSNGTVL